MVSFCNEMHTFYNLLRDSTARHKKKPKQNKTKEMHMIRAMYNPFNSTVYMKTEKNRC